MKLSVSFDIVGLEKWDTDWTDPEIIQKLMSELKKEITERLCCYEIINIKIETI